jgi:protein TonB
MISARAPRRRRLSAEARRMLPWCVALSASVHVLLLALLVSAQSQPRSGGWALHSRWRPARPIAVRLAAPATLPPLSAALSELTPAGLPATPASAASAASGPALTASSALPPENAPSASMVATAAAPMSAASLAAGDVGEALEGGYLPRPLLSIAPEPAIPVVIPTPSSSSPGTGRLIGRYSGVLALYIDEQGQVRRIEAEPPALPESMELAARAAFLGARFSPGQVDGRAVKSRIRVEVVFDDEPAQAASAASTASTAQGASSAARAASNQHSP